MSDEQLTALRESMDMVVEDDGPLGKPFGFKFIFPGAAHRPSRLAVDYGDFGGEKRQADVRSIEVPALKTAGVYKVRGARKRAWQGAVGWSVMEKQLVAIDNIWSTEASQHVRQQVEARSARLGAEDIATRMDADGVYIASPALVRALLSALPRADSVATVRLRGEDANPGSVSPALDPATRLVSDVVRASIATLARRAAATAPDVASGIEALVHRPRRQLRPDLQALVTRELGITPYDARPFLDAMLQDITSAAPLDTIRGTWGRVSLLDGDPVITLAPQRVRDPVVRAPLRRLGGSAH